MGGDNGKVPIPDTLILRLFKDESIKNNVTEFPVDLNMVSFIHRDSPNNEEAIYSLYGMVIHIGLNYRSGHFVAKVKKLKSSVIFGNYSMTRRFLGFHWRMGNIRQPIFFFMRGKRHWNRKRGINNYSK
uniref:Peptidase C19 ubiquitin carboxyl-terminal hydrolase domain-containing protein n=1 Tax=Meloidogyne incognita TaxID=6306 RepID=A0A914N499_MELIC